MNFTSRVLSAVFLFMCVSIPAFGSPKITEFSAELEMKDFHDQTVFPGPVEEGVPITLTFKNNTVVKLVPISMNDTTIRMKTELFKSSGSMLYSATFFTKYNADAELSEKKPSGDLIYRLKLNPHTAQ